MRQSLKPIVVLLVLIGLTATVLAQSDARRTTVAITYPLNQTIEVPFRGTTRLPRLNGAAKVRREGRRGTRVQLHLENLPRAYELGGVYTTFILWAISPDGHVDNLFAMLKSRPAGFNTSETPATISAIRMCQ